MTGDKVIFYTWEEVIINFFENKVAESSLFKVRKYIKENQQKIKSENNDNKRVKLIETLDKKRNELIGLRKKAPTTEIRDWIDDISKKRISPGMRIIKATHLLRFGHSSSTSDGILLAEKSEDKLLTTASIKKNVGCDMAHNNGALISISRFLALSHSGEMVIDLILDDEFFFLQSFTTSNEQLSAWKSGLKGLVERREIKTADKAKQVYFPVKKDGMPHHLLVPLLSSVIAEEIYISQDIIKYGEESNNIRKAMQLGGSETAKYYPSGFICYPNLAVQKFGGAQPQNVSMLNKGRTWKADKKDIRAWGVTYLMNCQPPAWQTQSKPPIYQKSFFDQKLQHNISKDDVDYLRDFLIRFDLIDLSINRPERRKWINAWVGRVIEDLLAHAATIQNMEPGWTAAEDIRLKREHQLFLDPYRDDEAFQAERKSSGWQSVVCEDFARWLNNTLVGKDKQFSPQHEHTRMWIKLIENPLREHDELIMMEFKNGKVKA